MKTKAINFILTLVLILASLASCTGESPETTPASETTTEHVCDVKDFEDVPGEHASICTVCNTKHLKSEAHTFVSVGCDRPKECSVCHAVSDEPSEGHDWKSADTSSDCWSTTVISTCTKCGMGQSMHEDYSYPQHTWSEESADGKTLYSCRRCSEKFTVRDGVGEFSYAEVLETYKIGDPGVKHEGFGYSDLDIWETDRPIDIVTKAELVLGYTSDIEYDTVTVSFDTESGTWRVGFYPSHPGGGCDVYINAEGKICYMVFGE